MAPQRYGFALRDSLGSDGYEALETMMEDKQKDLVTVDRFERRIAEEAAARREEIAAVRHEIGDVRLEIAGVRLEVAGVRQDIGAVRFDMLKWMFVFWVGQTFTIVGLVGAMLRFMRP